MCISFPLRDVQQIKCLGASATQELSGPCFFAVQPLGQGWHLPATPHHVPGGGEPRPRGRQPSLAQM